MGFRAIAALASFLVLTACGTTMTTEDFKSQEPTLVLEDYFSGHTVASGLFEDRFGNVRTQFKVDIKGDWDGQTLTLDEDFLYQDGSTENRRWVINKTGANTYTGTTDQAIGEAKGTTAGNAFNWKYKFNLKVGDGFWKVKFDDWMFLQEDGVLLNKATVYRWGFKIGTVFISFQKEADAQANTQAGAVETEVRASKMEAAE